MGRRIIVRQILDGHAASPQVDFDAPDLGACGVDVGYDCGRCIDNTKGCLLFQEYCEAVAMSSEAILLLLEFFHDQPRLVSGRLHHDDQPAPTYERGVVDDRVGDSVGEEH